MVEILVHLNTGVWNKHHLAPSSDYTTPRTTSLAYLAPPTATPHPPVTVPIPHIETLQGSKLSHIT